MRTYLPSLKALLLYPACLMAQPADRTSLDMQADATEFRALLESSSARLNTELNTNINSSGAAVLLGDTFNTNKSTAPGVEEDEVIIVPTDQLPSLDRFCQRYPDFEGCPDNTDPEVNPDAD